MIGSNKLPRSARAARSIAIDHVATSGSRILKFEHGTGTPYLLPRAALPSCKYLVEVPEDLGGPQAVEDLTNWPRTPPL